MVKGDVVFGTEKAPKKGRIGWIGSSVFLSSLLRTPHCFVLLVKKIACRICVVAMGVRSAGAGSMIYGEGDLPCPPTME